MNSTTDQKTASWGRIVFSGVLAGGGALVLTHGRLLPPAVLLGALFLLGLTAGALGRRQGWLSGLLAGFPLALAQVAAWISAEGSGAPWSHPDFWRLGVPAAAVASGVSVLGGITAVWMFSARRATP